VTHRASPRPEAGQATVELALALPVVLVLGLVLVQATLVLRDQLVVVHAAREAVRATSLDPDPGRGQTAAEAVLPGALVRLGRRPPVGELVAIEVHYRSPTAVPVVGPLLADVALEARAVMRVER
jgi:Flp pilus assembly protein TadG